jgi:hypothetical protein
VAWVFRFGPQNRQVQFDDLDLKITATVYWFGPQNQVGFDLSVTLQNRMMEDDVGHTSRPDDLLRLEASRARVSLSGIKTDGGATTSGARDIIMEVTLKGS